MKVDQTDSELIIRIAKTDILIELSDNYQRKYFFKNISVHPKEFFDFLAKKIEENKEEFIGVSLEEYFEDAYIGEESFLEIEVMNYKDKL
jgi:hypothetical protein